MPSVALRGRKLRQESSTAANPLKLVVLQKLNMFTIDSQNHQLHRPPGDPLSCRATSINSTSITTSDDSSFSAFGVFQHFKSPSDHQRVELLDHHRRHALSSLRMILLVEPLFVPHYSLRLSFASLHQLRDSRFNPCT